MFDNMKNLVLSALLAFMGFSAMAQHQTLFNSARVVGAFGASITEFGLGNDLNTSTGGGGALVINNFFIGGYGLASTDFDRLFNQGDVEILNIGHGGFWVGGTYQPWRLLHVYGSSRIGWGALNVDVANDPNYDDLDKIFVLTPEIGLELNVASWFRVGGTVGYRWVQGANEDLGYTNEDFSGATASLTLRFGWFGWRRQ